MEVSIIKHERVNLDNDTMKEVTIETLRSVYKIPKDAFINDDDNNLIVWHNTHGSGHDEVIRKATAQDKMILKVMKKVKGK